MEWAQYNQHFKGLDNRLTIGPNIPLSSQPFPVKLQSKQVKRSRRQRTNEFINVKMISFVDSKIYS